jgi:hypothetical protein
MVALACFIWSILAASFKSKNRLESENAALRRQPVVLQRKVRRRIEFTNSDRLFFILLYRCCPSVLKVMVIVRPEIVVRWHRARDDMFHEIIAHGMAQKSFHSRTCLVATGQFH